MKDKIYNYKKVCIIVLSVGMLAHGYMLCNKIINHDEIGQTFSLGATFSSGRWGLGILNLIPNYSMPWLNGIVSLIFVCGAVCCILEIFNIEETILQCLLGSIIITFPSLTGIFCYMFTSWAYAVAFFCSILSIYLIEHKKNIGAWICIVFSLSIYQAYITVTSSLMLLIIVYKYLNKKKNYIKNVNSYLKKYVLILLTALLAYYGMARIIMWGMNIEFNEYAAKSSGNIFEVKNILQRLYLSIVNFVLLFYHKNWGIINTQVSLGAHLSLVIGALYYWCKIRNNYGDKERFVIVCCSILLPISINGLYLFVAPGSVHTLALYSFIALYIWILLLINMENKYTFWGKKCVKIIFFLIIINNIWIANKAYLEMQLAYENAFSFYTSVITQVKQTEGFTEECKLALIGESEELVYKYKDIIENKIQGVDESLINVYSRNDFIREYCGFDIQFAAESEIANIKKSEKFKSMCIYPYYGSVRKMDNYIVIKLSNE